MSESYYFSFEEPKLFEKNIVCAFYVDYGKKQYYFYIVNEYNSFYLYYALMKSSEIINFVKNYANEVNLNKEVTFRNVFEIEDFSKKYSKHFFKHKLIKNQNYTKETIEKMTKDNIYEAKNNVFGLDGFSCELKLSKTKDKFYSWSVANDKEYYYVIDFINLILDEIDIDNNCRFRKR